MAKKSTVTRTRRGRGVAPLATTDGSVAGTPDATPYSDSPVSEHALAGLRMHVDERISRLQKQLEELVSRRTPDAVEARGYGTAKVASGQDIVESIRHRRTMNGMAPAYEGHPPSTPIEALERAKQGELPLWTGPTFSTGPADHALSEIVKIGKRLGVIEDFLEYLVRHASR